MRHTRAIKLAIDGDTLPTEFRLFVKGWNDTENGKFLFDELSAKQVMRAYQKWGVDLMIDLEHQMLEVEGGAPDPTARDARGWCKLELRNGELWACDVKWTPDGAQRLEQKRQRYVSPAFETDPKTKRVLKLINVAITALPATHDTPALVAASVAKGKNMKGLELARKLVKLASESGLDSSLVKQALDAIEKGDAKAALDILKNLVASAAGADPAADGDEAGSEGDGAEGVSSPTEAEALEKPKVVDQSAAPPGGDGDYDDKDEDDDKPEKKAARKMLRRMLCRLTAKKTFAEAVAEVEIFRGSHLALETERTKLAAERATLESAERRKLAVELVKLGAEFPATVWEDPAAEAKSLKARWAKMPIAELRSHVADQRAARKVPAAAGGGVQPPAAGGGSEVVELTADEQRICADLKCDPKDYAALKRVRDGKKGN